MTKKLYYDDQLQAAYMCREFGANYMGFNKDFSQLTELRGDIFIESTFYSDGTTENYIQEEDTKYYVHPESLDIFKPVNGDVGYSRKGTLYEYNYGWSTQCGKEPEFLQEKNTDIKIIQRNGKLFFTPKEEAK